jgi:hypothetical protein
MPTETNLDIKVRSGVPDDYEPMMRLAISACEENGLVRPNLDKLGFEIHASLQRYHGIVGIIGPVGGPFEAAILLRVDFLWYSDEPTLIERAIFVSPDFRAAKGGRAARLCEFAKTAALQLDLPLMIGILSSQRTEAKVRLYERQFGEPSGAYWLFNARTGLTGSVV